MKYTVYKITNKLDGKIYIGKHQTTDPNDDYMGSGKRLGYAKEKYGLENFEKEVLFVYDNEEEMNAKEAELVTEEFCDRNDTYNICPGGQGGWGYVNITGLRSKGHCPEMHKKVAEKLKGRKNPGAGKSFSEWHKNAKPEDYVTKGTTGMKMSLETRKKMSIAASGKNSSQYGTMWITNGTVSKKINKNAPIPDGWRKGRKMK